MCEKSQQRATRSEKKKKKPRHMDKIQKKLLVLLSNQEAARFDKSRAHDAMQLHSIMSPNM